MQIACVLLWCRREERVWSRDCCSHVDQVKVVNEHFRAAQDSQKKWVDMYRRPVKFIVGNPIFLGVSQ